MIEKAGLVDTGKIPRKIFEEIKEDCDAHEQLAQKIFEKIQKEIKEDCDTLDQLESIVKIVDLVDQALEEP